MKYHIITLLTLLLLLSAGCYNRSNFNYSNYPEAGLLEDSSVEYTELSAEEKDEKRKVLQKLAAEPYPDYRIDADDLLEIKVYNHPDLTSESIVTSDGSIGMMFIGQIKLAGCTIKEAVGKLEKALSDYIKNPVVSVIPKQIRSQNVAIAGGISKPGIYQVHRGMKLSDLFAMAGGSATRYFDGQVMDAADFKYSLFIRNKEIIGIDFAAAIQKGDPLNNIKLHKDDYIYIAVRTEIMVTLIGEVAKPHQRIWTNGLTLLELLAAGGGLKETYWQHAVIIRDGFATPKLFRINIDDILHGTRRNIKLEPGDIIYVPRDDISEYNVFVRKLMPTGQLINMFLTPATWYLGM